MKKKTRSKTPRLVSRSSQSQPARPIRKAARATRESDAWTHENLRRHAPSLPVSSRFDAIHAELHTKRPAAPTATSHVRGRS